jgi:hypothetical protein
MFVHLPSKEQHQLIIFTAITLWSRTLVTLYVIPRVRDFIALFNRNSPEGHNSALSTEREHVQGGGPIHLPRCDPEENLWPYYVMHVQKWQINQPTTTATHNVLNKLEFDQLTEEGLLRLFQTVGLNYNNSHDLRLNLLPAGPAIRDMYSDYVLPDVTVGQLSLEESKCHSSILRSQLQKLRCKSKDLDKEVHSMYAARRQRSVGSREIDSPTRSITDAILELDHVRHITRQHTIWLEKVEAHKKVQYKRAKSALPTTIHFPIGHTPYVPLETSTMTTRSAQITWDDINIKQTVQTPAPAVIETYKPAQDALMRVPVTTEPFETMAILMEDIS